MRMRFGLAAVAAISTLAWSAPGHSDTWPSRTITFVVPSSAGGGLDSLSRTLASEMGKQLGQTIIVDNRPGAVGMLGTQLVARAKPDGYTVLVTHSAPLLNAPFLFSKMSYDVRRDFTYVSELFAGSLVLAVGKDVPASNMEEFLAWAAQNKGKVSYGSFGVGSLGHLMGAYLSQTKGLYMTHVAYKGEAPMVQDLVGGQVQWAIASVGSLAPHIAAGKLRAIAVLGDRRKEALPNVPTMAEAGLRDNEYKPFGWVGMLVPAGTPPEIVARLEKTARIAVGSTVMKARFQVFGMEPVASTQAEFLQDFERTAPMVERMVKISGAKAE
ncbi:tripartite tricarboxylate transporter substrate binding protein [Cupriavidus taiwanensis]|uniref:Bug family tripartite tricarboxylate transporter substrate binding protein n=1 Tax=Cupriavidus taiwanensis TaxID=164546 RepID=UPI0025407FD5|nr:tripartite tricarboxylate transporter substrate binding protein [Cupriavidus taiwanensis]MDK3023408.1 tripartite tricarboxylate transporter substrate binding protein [Cupriavidus taiwanensis]